MYEPARLVFPDGTHRVGSPLTLGDELDAPGNVVVHEPCYPLFEQARAEPEG